MRKKLSVAAMVLLLAFSLTACFTVEKEIEVPGDTSSQSTNVSSEQGTSEDNSSSSESSDVSSEDFVSDADNNDQDSTNSGHSGNMENNTSTGYIKEDVTFNGTVSKLEANYTTFYVDNINGDDSNDGKTLETAWETVEKVNKTAFEPGTKVLFKADGIWDETLAPKSSGKAGKNIVFDMYGKGNKPIINGDGEGAAIILSALQYVEVRNFEVTNKSEYEASRKGVYVTSGGQESAGVYREGGMYNHIYLINLDIHDVSTNPGERWSGGIVFISALAKSPAAFNDVLVQGCTIKGTEGNGITFSSDYNNRTGVSWGAADYFPSTNVTLRNNFITDCAGDGIYLNCTNGSKIEYNTVTNTSYVDGPYAGIWPHNSTDCVMQYNEAYDVKKVGGDGQGFDVDINCERTVVQYNYSHDNEGGFLLICTDGNENGFNRDVTVRYNISQNDLDALFTLSGPVSDVKIYNNTFYVAEDLKNATRIVGTYAWGDSGKDPKDARFTNNIFYMNCEGEDYFQNIRAVTFDNNLFYGSYNFRRLPQTNSIYADPQFVNPSSGKIGINTVKGYKLKSTSPCIDAGKNMADVVKDYFGTKVPQNSKFDIGAGEYVK